QQVKRELGWLFAGAGARIISCTGGTDLRNDSRTLSRGVDIVVGTPGRLVDLVERKSLGLAKLEVVVLDEADEMLDMGFRDSLELLLTGAPSERRTLLFSATLPAEIRQLAKKYQKQAVSLDPRAGTKVPHEDIEHVAHLCAHGEGFAALVNRSPSCTASSRSKDFWRPRSPAIARSPNAIGRSRRFAPVGSACWSR